MSDYILGVNFGHDATVTLMKEGEILEAMSEERLSRQKKHIGFPHLSLAYIKEKYGIQTFEHVFVDGVKFGSHIVNTPEINAAHRNRTTKGKWFIRAVAAKFPGINLVYALQDFIFTIKLALRGVDKKTKQYLAEQFPQAVIESVPHHLSHAWASVPCMENFSQRRIILVLDGEGDTFCGSINIFEHGDVKVLHTFERGNSLGLLYCLLYTSPSPRDRTRSRMPSSA